MDRSLQQAKWKRAAWGFSLTAALCLPVATAPASASARATRAAPRPARPGAARPAAPRTAALPPLAQRSGVREAGPDELQQFYNELNRHGWQGASIALIPRAYEIVRGHVEAVGEQRATLSGDVDGDRLPEWIVGCYFPAEAAAPGSASSTAPPGLQDDRARLVVFKKDALGRWRFEWRSPGLGYAFRPSRFNIDEVEHQLDRIDNLRLPISLVSIDGKKSLGIAYYSLSQSGTVGGLPGIYRYDGSRWVSVAPHSDRFSLQDLDGDGKLEIVTGSRYIGFGSGDDDVPRVWRWNGREYQEASRDFPHYYALLAQRYEAYVRRMDAAGQNFNRVAWSRAIQKANSLAG